MANGDNPEVRLDVLMGFSDFIHREIGQSGFGYGKGKRAQQSSSD